MWRNPAVTKKRKNDLTIGGGSIIVARHGMRLCRSRLWGCMALWSRSLGGAMLCLTQPSATATASHSSSRGISISSLTHSLSPSLLFRQGTAKLELEQQPECTVVRGTQGGGTVGAGTKGRLWGGPMWLQGVLRGGWRMGSPGSPPKCAVRHVHTSTRIAGPTQRAPSAQSHASRV